MRDFLKRPIPMWVALALGAALLAALIFASWQRSYSGTLAGLREQTEMAPLRYQQPILDSYVLCRADWRYWPRRILFGAAGACPRTFAPYGTPVRP